MNMLLINGGPRKNWNTHKLLLEAERGAKESGAETEMIHLYDLDYKDCRSCFACKLRGNTTNGVCAIGDGLKPVLEQAADADALVIGSPIYYGNVTGQTIAFLNRLLFPIMRYEMDPQTSGLQLIRKKEKKCGLIVTMNAPKDFSKANYWGHFASMSKQIGSLLGSCETLYACDTYQFGDYSKYYAGIWDVSQKAKHRETQFPIDLKNAYALGKRLVAE